MIYLLFILSAVAKAFCDKIKYRPNEFWFQTDWWLAKGKFAHDKRTWLTKNIFSFVSDGWHFVDAVRVMSLCIIVTIALQIDVYWCIGFYIIHGLVFETLYKIK